MGVANGRTSIGAQSFQVGRRLLAATFVTLSGCLDFDELEIRVAHDTKRDQIDAQLIVRGLYSAANTEWIWSETPSEQEDVEGTERQLDQFLSGRPLFVSGWPLVALLGFTAHYDFAELRESDNEQVAELAKLITVDVGAPFRDRDGRLCGWQHVSIRDVRRAFELIDGLFRVRLEVAREVAVLRRVLGCQSRVSGALWEGVLQKKARWFEEVDGSLLWHVPASEGDALALMKRIDHAPSIEQYLARRRAAKRSDVDESKAENEVARIADVARDGDGLVVLLHALGVATRRTASGVDVVLWDTGRTPKDVQIVPGAIQSTRWDLAPYLEKRRVAIRTDVTDETLRRDVDERRTR